MRFWIDENFEIYKQKQEQKIPQGCNVIIPVPLGKSCNQHIWVGKGKSLIAEYNTSTIYFFDMVKKLYSIYIHTLKSIIHF